MTKNKLKIVVLLFNESHFVLKDLPLVVVAVGFGLVVVVVVDLDHRPVGVQFRFTQSPVPGAAPPQGTPRRLLLAVKVVIVKQQFRVFYPRDDVANAI